MPLFHGKSKKDFVHNLKTEMDAGKPQKQSLAIAYSMKRKKMAEGGEVEHPSMEKLMHEDTETTDDLSEFHSPYAHGGDVIDHIMRKRYSEGGEVANDTPITADFKSDDFDDLVHRDELRSTYGEDDNAGDELGDEQEDEDRKDIIARIMKQRSMKQRNPKPA